MIAEKVRSFGRRVEDSGPTGLVAVFGLEPVDNAASHAALAALAIHNAAARARTTSTGRADVVIGIHCGHHVVGRQGATITIAVDGKAATWRILEDLAAVARPGATVVTEAVVPFVTRRFVLERPRDPARTAWGCCAGRRPRQRDTLRRSGVRARDTPGRQRASGAGPRARSSSIVGEAGVGKSRLLHEAVRLLQGWHVLSSGGAPYATSVSYFPARGGAEKLLPHPGHRHRDRGARARGAGIAARGRRSGSALATCSTCWACCRRTTRSARSIRRRVASGRTMRSGKCSWRRASPSPCV